MAITAGTLVAATSGRKPAQAENLRIGNSSACKGIILEATNEIVLDFEGDASFVAAVVDSSGNVTTPASSNFPYAGADHHHIIYLKTVASSCEIRVAATNVTANYVLLSTATALGVVQTGDITDLPFRYVKVKAVGGTVTLDVQSFPALVR
jgi:hypothetical protein